MDIRTGHATVFDSLRKNGRLSYNSPYFRTDTLCLMLEIFLRVVNLNKARRSPDMRLKMASPTRTQSGPDCAPLSLTYLLACLLQGPKIASTLTYDESVVANIRRFH